jgi:hypothetical protein
VADATALPLPDQSVDVLFAKTLVDCLRTVIDRREGGGEGMNTSAVPYYSSSKYAYVNCLSLAL